jgi:multiple sugar transport system ATP-binding protein
VYEEPADLFVAGFTGSPPMNMLKGRLVRDGGMAVEVRNESSSLRFPLPEAMGKRVAAREGTAVVLGLRPETIFAAGTEILGPERFVFKRPVVVEELTGPDTMIVFEIGGQELFARVRPQDSRPQGTPFRFEVEMDRAKLFEVESGLRL